MMIAAGVYEFRLDDALDLTMHLKGHFPIEFVQPVEYDLRIEHLVNQSSCQSAWYSAAGTVC